MSEFLDQLINVSLQDPDTFRQLLDSRRRGITPALAEEAHNRFTAAFSARQGGYAAAAAITASQIYLRLGNRYEGLRHFLYFMQVQYMVASTEEAYEGVRGQVLALIPNAEEIDARDQAFEAATLAANCSYFTADLQDTAAAKERWLRQTLGDLVVASRYGPQAKRDGLEQFTSLLTGFMEAVTTLVPVPDGDMERQMRQLAQGVEGFVPVDFQFQVAGDREKSAHAARWLAVLSRRFGDSAIAMRRLALASGNDT